MFKITQRDQRALASGLSRFLVVLLSIFATRAASAACQADPISFETSFAIDPSQGKIQLLSQKDFSPMEVAGCSGPDSKYLQIAIENLFYETDIKANDYLVGQKYEKSCEIKSEIPLRSASAEQEENARVERTNFNRQCLAVVVTEQSGRKIDFSADQKFCKVTPMSTKQDSLILEGSFCFVRTNPIHHYAVKMMVKPECLKTDQLISKQIYSKDIETRLLVRETSDDTGRSAQTSVVALRNVRFSIVAHRGLFPTVSSDDGEFEFVSVLGTNMHQGPIGLRNVGLNRAQVDVKFLAEHFSDQVCDGPKGCTRVTDYNTPVVARIELSQIKAGRKSAVKEWYAPFRLPPQWSGIATPLFNIGLGQPVSQVMFDQALKTGDLFEVSSEFFEPRAILEILKYDIGFTDGTYDVNLDSSNSDSLPTLPRLAAPQLRLKLPELPRIQLGAGNIDWTLFNMRNSGEWTHYYDRVCDSNNKNCQRTRGSDQAFIKIVTTFQLGQVSSSGEFELKEIKTVRTSKVFGSYEQKLTTLPSRNCDLATPVLR